MTRIKNESNDIFQETRFGCDFGRKKKRFYAYVRMKRKACLNVGIDFMEFQLYQHFR